MATAIKEQIISLLNANQRTSGNRVYSTTSGDSGFLGAEIDTAIVHAKLCVKQAICETDGHGLRSAFISNVTVAHGDPLPKHYGTPGVPIITPYDGAANTLRGVRKSYEEIDSYRRNPIVLTQKLYGDLNHDEQSEQGEASPIAGYYAFVEGHFYFTGFTAEIPLADFSESDGITLPDSTDSAVVFTALSKLAKDGTVSEKFGEWARMSAAELNMIRTGLMAVPSIKPTLGTRDRGTK